MNILFSAAAAYILAFSLSAECGDARHGLRNINNTHLSMANMALQPRDNNLRNKTIAEISSSRARSVLKIDSKTSAKKGMRPEMVSVVVFVVVIAAIGLYGFLAEMKY